MYIFILKYWGTVSIYYYLTFVTSFVIQEYDYLVHSICISIKLIFDKILDFYERFVVT